MNRRTTRTVLTGALTYAIVDAMPPTTIFARDDSMAIQSMGTLSALTMVRQPAQVIEREKGPVQVQLASELTV